MGEATESVATEPTLLGRMYVPASGGPCVVTVRGGMVLDITSRAAPTVRDICEMEDPVAYVRGAEGRSVGELSAYDADCVEDTTRAHLLAPCDLQAVKACGVTFAGSMVERVIEERAKGDPQAADSIRQKVGAILGDSLRDVVPGSPASEKVKAALQAEGLWSQYLEVGIGPDAEVFSKAQVLSSVGHGARVGLHPKSEWNNPEPEVVLCVRSDGRIVGATLGNDVNLRDFEGRSALLLSKAKDNNASCAIGPFIRLFDDGFGLQDVRQMTLTMTIEGTDGFTLTARSAMSEISRSPEDLVNQTIGRHHQYPDGLMLFLGTLFAPTKDRDEPGGGFTHKAGDRVTISAERLGSLRNTVDLSTCCPPWSFGIRSLMTNLAERELI
jgi:fumarylacetoacetate (FAA) hydrolase family protein